MRILLAVASAIALTACDAPPPPGRPGGGVGFGDYDDYRMQQMRRAAAPAATVLPPAAPVTTAPLSATPAAVPARPAGISDEQNFDAVSARESIETDRERLARQRAQYQTVAPTAVPQRTGAAGPNIAAFALATTHPVGQQMYSRSNPLRHSQHERACARYASDGLAQEAFLARGGPERDPMSLDPDGDGYACRWDPAPFRTVRR